jgi:trimeric autotransporter adhesin
MKVNFLKLPAMPLLLANGILALFTCTAMGQAVPQITQEVNESNVTTLKNNVHPLAQKQYDQGAVPDSTPTGRLTLTLKRSPQQQNALNQFLSDVHTKGTASYHQWLTPAQFGQKYGPADSDMTAVESWLQSHGFTIDKVGVGRTAIEFSGTAGQVKDAFHTELHTYKVNGEIHHANSTNPGIPAALSPVIAAVGTLNDFHPRSQMINLGRANYNLTTHKVTPQWTIGSGPSVAYAVAPEDFATQYNVKPLYNASINGSGQTIGIINETNIDLGLVSAYRKLFGLDGTSTTPNLPHVIIDGQDPGINGAAEEAYLDVETAGAVAPQATVNLYTAADTDYNDGLDLAILRAVEDDTATVLSLSFGGCEAYEGAGYMTYINSVWQQAAAQGQTVMVATGDSGAAVCDTSSELEAFFGRQVNGLASSPWDIAVGGTDFYYNDYATGGASAANYWNTTNDANYGSLKTTIPEQAWNDTPYGFNIITGNPYISAGGGGQSTCAVEGGPLAGQNPMTTLGLGYCVDLGGFPKPAWQVGPGVPNDLVRDLPDISLFAAPGANNSFYPICAFPGDCVNTEPGTTEIIYSAVGGTSASTPAFAGIMALVNQKYGAQGQANYVLYPLAAQKPYIFHDVTIGSNNVQCNPGSLDCSADANGNGYSLQDWPATPGYDLASGLGSVDVNALVTNWSSVTLGSTTTTFSATPTTITHGQAVTLSASVAAGSGSTIPTGAVAVVADTTLPANKGQTVIPLNSTGAGTASVNSLPGGSYNLYGRYSGDTTFATSQSTPVSITVNPENSVIQISAFQNQTSPYPPQTPLGKSVQYGTIVGIDLQIAGAAGTVDGIATGTTAYSDNGSSIATLPLNSNGASVYSSAGWTVGSHSVTASYSGDASYNASTTSAGSPIAFTVTQGATQTSLVPNATTIPPGGSLVVQASVLGNAGGAPPSGNVTFTLGGQTQTAALTPGISPTGPVQGVATATFSNLTTGSYTLGASYSGDSNWAASTAAGVPVTAAGANGLASSTTTLVLTSPSSLSAIQPGTLVTFTATVASASGSGTAPTGTVQFITSGYAFGPDGGNPISLVPGSGATSTATITFPAYASLSGSNQFYAIYSGDPVYNTSSSAALSFNNSDADFSILTNNINISVSSGSSGTANLTLSSINQFSGNVTLTCTVTGSGTPVPLCTVPATVAVAASGQATATVQFATSIPATTSQLAPAAGLWTLGGGAAFASVFLLGIPARRRKRLVMFTVVLCAVASGALFGCGGGGTKPAPIPPTPTPPLLVPAGTYTAVIAATNGTTTHNVSVAIVVQ